MKQSGNEYIYNNWTKLFFRSLQLDVQWLRIPDLPEKYIFLVKKYLFLVAAHLFWNKKAGAYTLFVWNRNIFLESLTHIGLIQSTITNNAYLRNCVPKNATVIDIGAHTGEFALMCEIILCASKVYSFEPIEKSFRLLARNKHDDIYNIAIGKVPEITMYIPSITAMASAYPSHSNETKQTVRCAILDSIDEIKKLKRIDILKIDVEGMEYDVLETSKETLKKTNYLLLEISIDRPATRAALETLEYLHTIAPSFTLIHLGQIYGDAKRTDSVDLLFKNTTNI